MNYKQRTRAQGALFRARRTKPKSPDMKGKLTFTPALVRYIATCAEENSDADVELQLAAWRNDTGTPDSWYLTVIAQPPYDADDGSSKRPLFGVWERG